jgi:hypothetical protein
VQGVFVLDSAAALHRNADGICPKELVAASMVLEFWKSSLPFAVSR